jgi:hypothetical protein
MSAVATLDVTHVRSVLGRESDAVPAAICKARDDAAR